MNSLTRSIGGRSGLGQIGDIDLELANDDKEFSKLLANYYLKNQAIEIAYGYDGKPADWAKKVYVGIVEDHTLQGNKFKVKIRDVSQKYFKIKVPKYICTEDEYINIHENAKGKVMPEIIGLAVHTSTDTSGKVEAVYIDTVNWKFLAARGSLKSILNVYKDGAVLALGADYAITYEDGGRTYITLTANPESAKITFNCEGYMFADWNSVNDYVQNPARVLEFFLAFTAEVPQALINVGSFDDLAQIMDDQGAAEAGFLVLQSPQDTDGIVAELCWGMGARSFNDNDGRFKVKKKDISTFSANATRLFTQIDLIDFPDRKFNLDRSSNTIKARYDWVPAANLFQGVFEDTLPGSVESYEASIEPKEPSAFKWITDKTFVEARVTDELYRKGYGDQKIKFSLPAIWIGDLELMDDLQLQDEFGISATGKGESGKYIYIESMEYDFQDNKMTVSCDDLSYLLRQYFILGDREELADNWSTASDENKTFGYLAARINDKFANGEPGKILIGRDEMAKS